MEKQVTYRREENVPAKQTQEKQAIERLAEQAKNGDREALTELCKAIARNVLFRVALKVPNKMDAQDIAQEVLIRVCQQIRKLANPKAFTSWLSSIISNETMRFIGKNSKHAVIVNIDDYVDSEIMEEDSQFLPDDYAIMEEDRKMLMDIVKGLPERQLEAIVLHYYEHMSVTETADSMGITKQSVTRYLVLARDKIKNEMLNQSKTTGKMSSIAALPIGALLSSAFRQEAAQTAPVGIATIMLAVDSAAVEPQKAPSSPKYSSLLEIAVTFVVAVVLAGVICAGNITATKAVNARTAETNIVSTVVFAGGDAQYAHLNPTDAVVQADGEISILSWKITTTDKNTVLHSGEGGNASAKLLELTESGADGKYWIIYTIKDETGNTYTLRRSFFIRRENPSM